MLRSKKDVDRHVRDILSKVNNETERKLRGYNIARFYHNVGEHDIARRYLGQFLAMRPKAIDGHRLLGQIHEASGNQEKAVLAYKNAYELGVGQKDLVIKICELYCKVPCDVSVLMHWADEVQRLCPHHEAVIRLRSTIIANSSDSNSRANLQELYLDQIKVNPTSAELQSNLVRLYLEWSSDDARKLDEAYSYVCEVEARRPFTHSLLWYQTLLEVADSYEKQGGRTQPLGVEFHSWLVTALDRLVHLTLAAASPSAVSSNSDSNREAYLTDAANLLRRFDNKLAAVKKMNCTKELEQAMSGQLVFHLAQYVMMNAKRNNTLRNPNMLSCLLLHSCVGPLPDSTSHPYFHKLACYRMSQSYHILHSMARDSSMSSSTLLNKVRQQCSNRESKEEAFRAVFGSRVSSDQSYFLHHSGYGEQELSIPSSETAQAFDQIVSTSESSQLREIVWLYLQEILRSAAASSPSPAKNASLNFTNLNTSLNSSTTGSSANLNSLVNSALKKNQPYYPHRLFDGLQFATSHLNSAVADSLCHLDLLAFLAATIYCELENGVCSGSVRSAVCKTSLCSGWLLHTPQQDEWWNAAHDLFVSSSRRSVLAKGVSKCRQIVQKGLEAVRVLAAGGVSVSLAVHIARCFTHWASSATDDADVSISEVTALEERAEHCWQRVLSMCGKGKVNMPSSVHTPRNQLFSTTRHDVGALKLDEVEEEGRLFLAKRLIRTGRRQEALQALGQLRSPEASFQRAMVYKQQANEMVNAVGGDLKLFTNEQRGQHTLYLTQARDTLYLTLDRLRMPGVDRNHPLNAALSTEMTSVERALASITADIINTSFLEADGESEPEPLSPIRHNLHDTSVGGESLLLNGSNFNTTTPARRQRATSTLRLEARPSPERLDAQVRHLTSVQEQTLQNLAEQNAALRNQNSALRDTCNAVSSQVKENAQLFRTILENNKSLSLDCYYNILTEIKSISLSVKDLQDDVQKLKLEVSEMKAASNRRHDDAEARLEGLPAHPTPPPHQNVLSQLYMGCYGGQVGAGGVPHPLASHLLPPHTSMLPGHAPHGSPFLPPATLAEPAYLSGTNAAGLHVNRILGGLSTMSSVSNTSTASSSAARMQELQSLAPPVTGSTATGLLPAPYGVSSTVSMGSGTLSGILSTPYGSATSNGGGALPAMLASTYPSLSTAISSPAVPATAPHNYQIPLPVTSLSGAAPFPRQSSDRSSSMIPTAGLLASVPPPIYSAVTPDNSPLSVSQNAATPSTSQAPTTSLQTMFLGGSGLTPVSTPLAATPLTGKIKTIPQRDLRQADVSELSIGAAGASGDLSAVSNTSNEYYHDDGHDPCPDFVPVVPLPAKVEVCTGEEDEQVLFEDRARLYRMSSKEWKERGTGVIKILHNSPKKTVRVLMRRDQTYKICANHFVTPTLQLKKLQKHDNVWLWAAQDFADEELTSETFCCRFKTVEVASRFNRAITEAKMLASDYLKEATSASSVTVAKSTSSTAKPLSELFKKAPGSWTCSTCCVVNSAGTASCIACSSSNPNVPASAAGSATPSTSGALDLSANSLGFKFGLQSTTSIASPIFSSLPPAKGSGSITFGISGQSSTSKASPFSTPTPALFSTPVSKTVFSVGISQNDTPSTLFVTPSSSKPELSTSATTIVTTSSLLSTPLAPITASLLTPSAFVVAAAVTTVAGTIASTSLFGTPVTSTKFSVVPPSSSIFAPASSVLAVSSAAATTVSVATAQSKTVFGGFSFTSTPSIAAPKEEKEVKKEETPKKPSIFSTFTFSSNSGEGGVSSPFTFKKEDPSSSTASTGGLFSNIKTSDTLTFGAVAGDSSALGASDVFKTKDANAFKPQPLFAGNTSKNNTSTNALDSSEKVEEFEPEVHFEPVIPLPELVQVKTGEEDEEELFCERAKLFRWADATKEWKERGLGDIKILSNAASGKFRVLMRREKTLKICANHYITPDLSINLWNDSDKALMWAANDFADGAMVRELFAIRFKLPELASAFKGKFENTQQMLRDKYAAPAPEKTLAVTKSAESDNVKALSLMDLFKPAAGSWECDICLLRNKPDAMTCASCQALKPGASASDVAVTSASTTSSFSFGINSGAPTVSSAASGFSTSAFTFGNAGSSKPAFSFGLPASTAPTSVAPSSSSLTSVAPATFEFKPSTPTKNESSTNVANSKSGFKFGSPEKFEFSFTPRPPRSRDTSHCESEDGVVEEDDGDHLYFEPVVPLPDKVAVVTGEEEESVVYCHRAKLYRKAGPEWKERGLGEIKILRHRSSGRVRLLMRREQVHKICLNHYLTEGMKFNDKDEKSFYWVAQDFSEETPSLEAFAIRFKTYDIAQAFKKAAADALSGDAVSTPPATVAADQSTIGDQTDGAAASQEASGVARARELLLPDDFFAYENFEENCSGCIGCKVDTLPPFLQPETPPDNVLKDFPRDQFPCTPSFVAQSVFGSKAGDGIPTRPLFGTTPSVSSASLSFGSAPSHSLFGGASGPNSDAPKSNVFSGPSVSSIFGGASTSVFGGTTASSSVFGSGGVAGSQASIFGGVSSGTETPSVFGGISSSTESPSVFGGVSSSTEKPSIFGGFSSSTEKPPIFGSVSSGTEKQSIFGGVSSGSEKPSVFGSGSGTASGTSLFGGLAASTATPGTSMFGGATSAIGTQSLFGGAATSSSASLFGGSPAVNSGGSLFGGSKTTTSQSIFGGTPSLFSSSSSGTSDQTVFAAVSTTSQVLDGGSSKVNTTIFKSATVSDSTISATALTPTATLKFGEGTTSGGGSLFGGSSAASNKGFLSFSDITSGEEGFKSKNSSVDMSAWQAKPLFASLNKSNNQSKDDSSDQLHQEEDSHDPHFEPVIPMPDLVEVKTGEENLEVIYSHRSKTFRYDNNTKEWKERGLGDIKILYDPVSQKFRLLQRREQIHKLAVHHYLMPGQKLTPLASSETAWCWYAQDFSEDPQGSREQLAAKFKNADIAKEFKAKFEECVAKVERLSADGESSFVTGEKPTNVSTTLALTPSSVGVSQPSVLLKKPQQYTSDTESSETGDEDEDDDDDDYVDSSIMFEKACHLEKRLGENWDTLGTVILRIVYESDSDGARLMATDEGDLLLLDHILSPDLTYEDLEGTTVSWAALDLSTHPACHVKLRATFNDDDDKEIFIGTLEEGREFTTKGGTTDEDEEVVLA